MDIRKYALPLMALMAVGQATATSYLDITSLTDTIADMGTLIGNVADIMPDVIDLAIQVVILIFVLGLFGAILGFITGVLSFDKIMRYFKK